MGERRLLTLNKLHFRSGQKEGGVSASLNDRESRTPVSGEPRLRRRGLLPTAATVVTLIAGIVERGPSLDGTTAAPNPKKFPAPFPD